MQVIEARDLGFARGRRTVLQGVTFSVSENELVGLIGPNGGGKTTLLRLLLGLLRPTRGSVRVFDRDPRELGELRERLGYVAQAKQFERHFPARARDVVLMGLYRKIGYFRFPGAADRRRADEALAAVGLEGRGDRPLGSLSGGERQRVFIAHALVSRPRVLMLDEPTVGVDRDGEEALMDRLVRLRSESGLTVLMVSHNTSLIRTHTDRILCLNRELYYNGPADGLDDGVLDQAYHAHPEGLPS